MHPADCHIDCVLDYPVIALDSQKVAFYIIVKLDILECRVVLSCDFADFVYLLLECLSHERSHIEVEGWYCLASVHFILHSLHRDAAEYAGRLYPFGRT